MTEEGEFKKRFDIEGLVIMSDSPEEYEYSRQDGLRAYQGAIPKEFYTMKASRTQHVRIPNIRDRSNNNMVERLHGTIRQKAKTLAELFIEYDRWKNLFRKGAMGNQQRAQMINTLNSNLSKR